MSSHTLCITGFARDEAADVQSQFEQANARLGNRWLLAPESDADVLLIDMDSMYGHMTFLKAHGNGKRTIGLTAGSRSETDHMLSRPVTVDALAKLLEEIADQVPAAAAPVSPDPARTTGQQAAMAPANPRSTGQQPAMPADPVRTTGQQPAMPADPVRTTGQMPAMPPREPRLGDYLKAGVFPGPVKAQLPGAPLLALDPTSQTYAGGSALKVFLPYAESPLKESDFTPIDASEFASLCQQLGGSQPWSRLAWLSALAGGKGAIAPGYSPNALFKLTKWPQTEREYPKHFRIATVMMKGPARLTDIAEQCGSTLAEVTDFVNANLVTGYATTA